MKKVIAISTNKGGVGKTSLTTNLAGVLAQQGKKILIVDTDNQGNTALSFGHNPDNFDNTIYDVLVSGVDPKEAVIPVYENIWMLPANDDMSFFEFDVLQDRKKFPDVYVLLRNALAKIEADYDHILIDTPPNLGLTQGNVLCASDEVLIPFQPENYSMRSLQKILQAIENFKDKYNPDLSILGIVGSMVRRQTVLHSEIMQLCRQFATKYNVRCFDTVIPQSIRFAASVAYDRLPAVLSADKSNELADYYVELMKEIQEAKELV
jgi:chromosome partitioning protein